MLYMKNLALIGLLAALVVEARPIAQAQDYDLSEADQQGGRSSHDSVTRTGGFGESSGRGRWASHHRNRPSGASPAEAGFTGKPSGIGFGGGYGGGDAAGGWGGKSSGGEDGERPAFPGATGMPSAHPQPSGSERGSVVLPSGFGGQPTPGAPDGPIGSELSPTATISEAPMETFPVVSDDLGEGAGGSATPVVPVGTPTLTEVEIPVESATDEATGVIPIESGSAPSPIVTIPVGNNEPASDTDLADADAIATPSITPVGNMAFHYGGDWNRPAGTRSYNLPSAQSGSVSFPAFQPSAAEPVQTLVEPSTEWEANPGSGPIIDQDRPLDDTDGTAQAFASVRPL